MEEKQHLLLSADRRNESSEAMTLDLSVVELGQGTKFKVIPSDVSKSEILTSSGTFQNLNKSDPEDSLNLFRKLDSIKAPLTKSLKERFLTVLFII